MQNRGRVLFEQDEVEAELRIARRIAKSAQHVGECLGVAQRVIFARGPDIQNWLIEGV